MKLLCNTLILTLLVAGGSACKESKSEDGSSRRSRRREAEKEKGSIHVEAQAGAHIQLNGILKGTTNADGELALEGLEEGTYEIKASIPDHRPEKRTVRIKEGEKAFIVVASFAPDITVTQGNGIVKHAERPQTGSLTVGSVPNECTIQIESLKLNSTKKKQSWLAEGIPPGRYEVTAVGMSKTLTPEVEITGGRQSFLLLNFAEGKVSHKPGDVAIQPWISFLDALNKAKPEGVYVTGLTPTSASSAAEMKAAREEADPEMIDFFGAGPPPRTPKNGDDAGKKGEVEWLKLSFLYWDQGKKGYYNETSFLKSLRRSGLFDPIQTRLATLNDERPLTKATMILRLRFPLQLEFAGRTFPFKDMLSLAQKKQAVAKGKTLIIHDEMRLEKLAKKVEEEKRAKERDAAKPTKKPATTVADVEFGKLVKLFRVNSPKLPFMFMSVLGDQAFFKVNSRRQKVVNKGGEIVNGYVFVRVEAKKEDWKTTYTAIVKTADGKELRMPSGRVVTDPFGEASYGLVFYPNPRTLIKKKDGETITLSYAGKTATYKIVAAAGKVSLTEIKDGKAIGNPIEVGRFSKADYLKWKQKATK